MICAICRGTDRVVKRASGHKLCRKCYEAWIKSVKDDIERDKRRNNKSVKGHPSL